LDPALGSQRGRALLITLPGGKALNKAGEILGIEILDHIVISRTDFVSLKERGVM
jgi:hypothetical protein